MAPFEGKNGKIFGLRNFFFWGGGAVAPLAPLLAAGPGSYIPYNCKIKRDLSKGKMLIVMRKKKRFNR